MEPKRPLTEAEIEKLREASRDRPFIFRPEPTVRGVMRADGSVELMRPRRWGDWLLLLVVLCWGFVMGFIAFAEGVDRGTTIGIESCRAGDTVLVDPGIGGEG